MIIGVLFATSLLHESLLVWFNVDLLTATTELYQSNILQIYHKKVPQFEFIFFGLNFLCCLSFQYLDL